VKTGLVKSKICENPESRKNFAEIQSEKTVTLLIRSSAIHAAGCYTTSPIRNGARVVEYTGPRISKEQADEKYEHSPTTYLFGIGDGSTVIDGHGMAMFLNHSCDPNCETDEVRGRVWIKAIRNIAPGEELTYDYNLYDGDDDEAICNCGAATCRGSMYSPEELRRRARAAKRASVRAKRR
jgi:SET domain-containing protein